MQIVWLDRSLGWVNFGGKMDFFSGVLEGVSSFQWETLFQLVSVALIMIAGPAVIFVLAFRNGNL